MKKIIITGSNGQLGRAMNDVFRGSTEYELVNTDVHVEGTADLDITDLEGVIRFVEEVKPYAIVNCAALTAVDACEVKTQLAYQINAIGPRNLAIAASKCGAKLVHVSTDYVFPGNGTVPYTEFDTPAPLSAYGRTKLAGEEFVKQFAREFFIVRTAWLYGDGKNFVRTMLQVGKTHDEVSVVCDQVGSPTSAKELAQAIASLIPTENYGIFHGTCEGVCSWADFTTEIYRLAGMKTKVNYITSEEYKAAHPESADRPHYSVLENSMFKLTGGYQYADWKDAIAEYMENVVL